MKSDKFLDLAAPYEPIAIIGMACRLPGSKTLSGFWRRLIAGENAVVEGPPGSVIGRTGRLFPESTSRNEVVRYGAFVEDLELFDAEFFRMSPVEAQMLDPQQRMMLETSWHALEDAAIDPGSLRGSRTGVYAGVSIMDYRDMAIADPGSSEAAAGLYAVTGTSLNTAIGRVSFVLGLEGPAMAIDTACSSSLVAIHQAVGALQRFEAGLVLAGGVHTTFIAPPLELRAHAGMLSPTGRCWTFDAAADGFVSGEGCGMVVLKRLTEAVADGDRIWAVIRGSSVNQDGASQGLTVPSGPSQERVIEEALARAGASPSEVDYLEAHGTGTIVGDPIEMSAAAAVYGRERPAERPLLVGSVKTNIGHLGPAAGVAGLIKTVLAMRHGVIPRHLNFKNPNPRIDWDSLPVRVTDATTDWPRHPDCSPRAGVSAFGWSGTNAHLLVEGYGREEDDAVFPVGRALPVAVRTGSTEESGARTTRFLPLSGRSPEALRDAAARYQSWLDERRETLPLDATAADPYLSDAIWTAASGRNHFAHRAGVVFRDVAELRKKLTILADGDSREAEARPPFGAAKVAFVFTGQASQWVGMGRDLYETEPVFRAALDRCDGLLREERGISLLDVMFGGEGADGLLDEAAWTQPTIYSLECALTALWASVGVAPSVVVGHSLGEMAAAQAAGVFSLEDGLRFVAARGALMGATRQDGAMAAVFAPASRVASAVAAQNAASEDGALSVAVDNGLQQVVSGPAKELEAVLARFESEEVKVVRLRRSPAYHSALIEPALDDLEAVFRDIVPAPPPASVPLVSNLTGRLLEPDKRMDAAYWRRQAREPVAFRGCVETLAEMGVDAVVEIGPHAVLGPVVAMNWPESAPGPAHESSPNRAPVILASLQRPPQDPAEPVADTSGGFVEAVAGAYAAGLDIAFDGLFAGEARRRVALPGYPFQRVRHWVQMSKRRELLGHPLLGSRHESPRGEVMFETEVFASDPAWLQDHLVYDRVVAPGALYGAMAASAAMAGQGGPATVADMQLHNPLILGSGDGKDLEDRSNGEGRKLHLVLDGPEDAPARRFEVFSKGETEAGWTLHADGRLSSDAFGAGVEEAAPVDLDDLRAELPRRDPAEFYRMKWSGDIHLGPVYHTLQAVWARKGEALGELALGDSVDASGMEMHPLLLDGCFQISAIARYLMNVEQGAVYLPFGWEYLWVAGPLPSRIVCHAVLRNPGSGKGADAKASTTPPQVLTGDVRLYSIDGAPIGILKGYIAKRATRSALLSAREGIEGLLYEVAWREKPLGAGMRSADFLTNPETIASRSPTFVEFLAGEGVEAPDRVALLRDQETLSRAYALAALEALGWKRKAGEALRPEDLRRQLGVTDEHRRLFARILGLLCDAGVLTRSGEGFTVALAVGDPLPGGPDESLSDPERLAGRLMERHAHGVNELGLLRRCGSSLAEVLQGRKDPLGLLFSDEGPGAASLYLTAPASQAANRMLGEAVAAAVSGLPEGRRLRVLEVGAGTGSATESILSKLPEGRFDYAFTDISAGFFAQAEARFAATGASIEYRSLDIESEPTAQGFDAHGYDLVIAANVLHATRDLGETLAHCRDLLAPSGQLVALEGMRRRAWQDLTFGLLDGWWRFADEYRPNHALATPTVWRQALTDAGFSDIAFPGTPNLNADQFLGSSVILARGPAEIAPAPGAWILAADETGVAAELAADLARRNQTVLLVSREGGSVGHLAETPGIAATALDPTDRKAWRSLLEGLPEGPTLRGVVHLMALDGHGASATTREMAEDVTHAASTGLALAQGLIDAGASPTEGVWFVTCGAQGMQGDMLGKAYGQLAGAALWGFGKVLALEAAHLQPRLLDLDPAFGVSGGVAPPGLAHDFLRPGRETHIAYRGGSRYAARLVRSGIDMRMALPADAAWRIDSDDPEAGLAALRAKPRPAPVLKPGEIRVAVEAAGLNFGDVLLSLGLGLSDQPMGREMYGRVLETAPDVAGFSVGDPVVGMGFGAFTPELVVRADLASHIPDGFSALELAAMPICFVTAELAFEISGLKAGERVLIHSGAGGLGLAAIQLAHAAGAKVFATASAPKQAYLRSLGVEHVFDSRRTAFGEDILKATDGAGVHVALNSLTGEGFIEATLSCLARSGRFVEIGKRGVWSKETMAAARPDVAYSILDVDSLKQNDPARPGGALSRIMARLSAGELTPLPCTVWPLAEARSAMEVMRDGRHIGKNVFRTPPLARGALRQDRAYLVTGGLGGIGCAVARWLAENGAGVIVLNGRREPDPAAEEAIRELRAGGADIRVELADVTDSDALDAMLARIEDSLPPLGGVIHSVGVLSDGAIENQTWERFEQVLWPKVLGAWRLHQATQDKDLDMFILFSSVSGVLGNPGQSNHAAANAFLDQLAAHRRALGLPGQSIAWGAWSEIGEAEEHRQRIEKQLVHTGAGWIAPQQGMAAFDRLVRQDVTASTVTMVDWSVVARKPESGSPFLEELLVAKKVRTRETEDRAPSASLLTRLQDAPAEERQNLLAAFIQQELKAVLRLASLPSPTVSFFDLGMDSLMAVELRNRINRAFAGAYSAANTVVFDYPNAASLASHLVRELGVLSGSPAGPEESAPVVRPRVRHEDDRIAIVGMACRFPGAPDISAFWRLLESGADAVTDGRQDAGSWNDLANYLPSRYAAYRRGGFVQGIDQFDARFFRISPIEARTMDPRQRIMLETTWQAIEDAGIDPNALKGSRTGIYVGVGASEYRDLMASGGHGVSHMGTSASMTVGRLAFFLGLEGPTTPVELDCASSLVAVHQAMAGLRQGEVDMALVGGTHAVLSSDLTRGMADLGVLSRDGRCKTFDARADGFVRGEGCGMIVLKRLSEAEADGDRIWGVLRGSAVNQNGASAAPTMPNGPAQERVIAEALSRAGVAPADIDYLEAHGGGSELGDPIEVQAAVAVYGKGREADRPLWIGSVKTNIGHLEPAAGVAALIKTALAMKRGKIPKHLHFEHPNPHIAWDRLPVQVAPVLTDWPRHPERPPRAGVSAFGISGANAHVVVEGYGSPDTTPVGSAQLVSVPGMDILDEKDVFAPRQTRLLPLSGKSAEALRDLARRYVSWLDDLAPDDEDVLADMAWTAGTGRSHFDYRAGALFECGATLRERLHALIKTPAETGDREAPPAATKVAFAFAAQGGEWIRQGKALYESEPVVRAVLDRCDQVIRSARNASLLDEIFGKRGAASGFSHAAVYALESALAALWSSVGIRPGVVVGHSVGEVAAAHAAGVFSLEDGLRMASARDTDSLESALADVTIASPSLVLASSVTGGIEVLDAAYWRRQAQEPAALDQCARKLASLKVDVLIEIGPNAAPDRIDGAANPLIISPDPGGRGFAEAVAKAYEAGLSVSFSGLFAGETRRRIAVPGYPFQRLSYWLQ